MPRERRSINRSFFRVKRSVTYREVWGVHIRAEECLNFEENRLGKKEGLGWVVRRA